MSHLNAFNESLETVAAVCEDVVPPVYSALFERYPDMQRLFVLDTDGGARGHMLNEALTMAEGLLSGDMIAPNFIRAERMNHEGYGIDEATFTGFFQVMQQVFMRLSAQAWTTDMTEAWDEIITRVSGTVDA